jgi:hypothetical protein
MKPKPATSSISLTLDKRTVERLRLLKKVKDKSGESDINKAINNLLLPMLDSLEKPLGLSKESWKFVRVCPSCSGGVLIKKKRRNDAVEFYGCSNYPKCRHSEDAK